MLKKILYVAPLCLLLTMSVAVADDAPVAKTAQSAAETLPVPKETSSVTQHSITINGETVKYTATAGNLVIDNDKGDAIGSFFYVA
ncbi:MAG TPA: peptidase S10, partial [Gammaproteobacteria bacterium]